MYSKNHVGLLVTAPFLIEIWDKQLYMLHQKKKSLDFFHPLGREKKKKERGGKKEGREGGNSDKRIYFHIMSTLQKLIVFLSKKVQ